MRKWGKWYLIQEHTNYLYLWAILIITASSLLFQFVKSYVIRLTQTWVARRVHSKMIYNLLHSKVLDYLQRIPEGVILNRFSNDIYVVDDEYGSYLDSMIHSFSNTLIASIFILFAVNSLIPLISIVFYIYLGFKIRQQFMVPLRDVTRLAAITKSYVVGLPTSMINGGAVIRCMRNYEFFVEELNKKINDNSSNLLLAYGLKGRFAFSRETWNTIIVIIPLYALSWYIFTKDAKLIDDTVKLGVFMFSVMNFSGFYIKALTMMSYFEISLISLERCMAFEELEPETGYKKLEKESQLFEKPSTRRLKKAREYLAHEEDREDAFKTGNVEFVGVFARYPACRRDAISNATFSVYSGQKIGIVGRSGSGKSTFIKMLWRALDPYQGQIKIDGININDLDLKEYRSQLNIILQKPNLFEGTLESNISSLPMSPQTMNQVRDDLIDLGFPPSKLAKGDLSFKVASSGSNLSQSEKQVICLIQSLQSHAKVVIYDEATAYVDIGMEKKFQKMVMRTFKDATMFIVAHRISNIMDCDRVFVFEKGEIVEDGPPQVLLWNRDGFFYEMWQNR